MRKLVLLLLVLITTGTQAQLNTKEKGFTLDLGAGATLHNVFNNVNTGNGSSAFANLVHLNVRYKDGVLGYGLKFEHLTFATSSDSAVVFRNAVANLLQYNTSITLIERKKSNVYLATGIGVNALNYEQRDSAGVFGKVKMQGFSASFALGINYHFKGKFGVFAQAGYIYNVNHLTDFRVNGNFIEEFENRELEDVVYNLRGIDFKTGIRFAF